MDRALKILAALYATAAALLLGCIVAAVFQYVVPDFTRLEAHPRNAALLGLGFGYLVMFVLVYAQLARLLWRKERWTLALILAGLSCLGFPVGPVLGIAALVFVTRPKVRAAFRG